MARAGILYSDVAQAATKLAADDKNPTVDNVREILGTGSKSTIAPLLKRWKAEHEDQVSAIDTGLPHELLQVVKGLYELVQHNANIKIEEIQASMDAATIESTSQLTATRDAATALMKERDDLLMQLSQERSLLEKLEGSNHALQLACTKTKANLEGLSQRLTDRQTEVDNLHRQLDQARTQFEHYQASIAAQRADERQQAEQTRTRFENDMTEARRTISLQQTSLGQVEVQLSHVNQERDRTSSELTILKADHLRALSERQWLDHQLSSQTVLFGEQRVQLDNATAVLTHTSTELAILQSEKPQLQMRISSLEGTLQELREQTINLMLDKARLEGLLDQAAVQQSAQTG
jgi:chromosome segregation ATPase